ncbi:oxidoreductase [Nannizzia gypsea CBS 118893]|uniref:Oxidoreductase n=1 Tax=Arthroderma gypseum (strain ATCC MYA-4604 / CBS 118893) TaxID=535722 RepID=E4URA7_ARTGP|nr:oxidoreductase [Nannizzia gypsea CBS 118893]EFR00170.1 oxidoreductase [Nannizzia gypsea CBS 118893]
MPLPILAEGAIRGISAIPYGYTALKTAAGLAVITALKRYFGGATNKSDRLMHSKVVMVTGGTSGIGAAVVRELASRGAQVIILTQHSPSDPFIVDYIEDLRTLTGNELIYAEQVDLSSLYSIRLFATKWIDNSPVRRLDMVVLCANTQKPSSSQASHGTSEGLQEEWQINYLANYHLLSILSPALRAQPPDRDVRVIFTTCSSYIGANKLDLKVLEKATVAQHPTDLSTTKKKTTQGPESFVSSSGMYATSKLALMVFARSFQQHLTYTPRTDKLNNPLPPPPARVLVVDPGFCRTPGTRRWLTGGSLWGLLFYLITWPIWWVVLKSSEQGAQTILMAAMEANFSGVGNTAAVSLDEMKKMAGENSDMTGRKKVGIEGGTLLKECKERLVLRKEIMDEKAGKELWEFSQRQIEQKEKETALLRAMEKKAREEEEKEQKKPSSSSKEAKKATEVKKKK